MAEDWRRVVAALAHADAREAWARIVLGEQPATGTTKRDRALEILRTAGLASQDTDAAWHPTPQVLSDLLAVADRPRQVGVERFLSQGRIVKYPARPAERHALLELLRDRLLPPNAELTERAVNEALAEATDDTASLRRSLVDAGLLTRSPDGAIYRTP